MFEALVEKKIRNIPDFPKPGIQFKDITPVLADHLAFNAALDWFSECLHENGRPDVIAGIESRGFIFGAALARQHQIAFIPVRKPGKLPYKTIKETYDLEYGSDSLEIHIDALKEGDNVVIIDDLLATGGTAAAAARLIKKAGANAIMGAFLIELKDLKGIDILKASGIKNIKTLVRY